MLPENREIASWGIRDVYVCTYMYVCMCVCVLYVYVCT
jgi:hypothetical protein